MQWILLFLSVVSLLSPASSFSFAKVSDIRSVEEKDFSRKVQRRRQVIQHTNADDACKDHPPGPHCDGKPCKFCAKIGSELYVKFEGFCETVRLSTTGKEICRCSRNLTCDQYECEAGCSLGYCGTTPSIAPTTQQPTAENKK